MIKRDMFDPFIKDCAKCGRVHGVLPCENYCASCNHVKGVHQPKCEHKKTQKGLKDIIHVETCECTEFVP